MSIIYDIVEKVQTLKLVLFTREVNNTIFNMRTIASAKLLRSTEIGINFLFICFGV